MEIGWANRVGSVILTDLAAAEGIGETELDRHLIELVLVCSLGDDAEEQKSVIGLVEDLLALNPARKQSYRLAGLCRELLLGSFRSPPDGDCGLFESFGRLDGLLRCGFHERARQLAMGPDFESLLKNGAMAAELTARLATSCHQCGDQEAALAYLEKALELDRSEETLELATDLVKSYLSRSDQLIKEGKLDEATNLLEQVTRREPILEAVGQVAVRVYRKLGQCDQRAGEWEGAAGRFQEGLKRNPSESQRAVLWCDIGLCLLGLASINHLARDQERPRRDEAREAFERAVSAGEGFSINGAFARGVLALEDGEPEKAAELLDLAHRSLKTMKMRNRSRIDPRIKGYLAEALLTGREALSVLPKAMNLLRQAQAARSVSSTERFQAYELVRTVDESAARNYLDELDFSRLKKLPEGLSIGEALLSLGEWDKALEVADGLLQLFLKKGDRQKVLVLKLKAQNGVADVRGGGLTYLDLKQLCLDHELLEELEEVLVDEGCVSEILDAQESRKERLELYGLMPERRTNRAVLLMELARNYINGKDEEGLRTAKVLIEEASLYRAELPEKELDSLDERLEFEAQRQGIDLSGEGDPTLVQRLRAHFASPPRILVVGGNEKQMGDQQSFQLLGEELHFVGEWIPADYVNPDKPLAVVRARLQQGLKGLVLLHYNRTEFGRSARKLAGDHDVVLRNLHLYGFKSLKTCILEVLDKMLRVAERQE